MTPAAVEANTFVTALTAVRPCCCGDGNVDFRRALAAAGLQRAFSHARSRREGRGAPHPVPLLGCCAPSQSLHAFIDSKARAARAPLTLSVRRFNTGLVGGGGDCDVCMEHLPPTQRAIGFPCGHAFHTNCAKPWLESHNTCPTCRFELSLPGAPRAPRARWGCCLPRGRFPAGRRARGRGHGLPAAAQRPLVIKRAPTCAASCAGNAALTSAQAWSTRSC